MSSGSPLPERRRAVRRGAMLAAAALVVLLPASLWLVAGELRSPEQVQAAATPPEAAVVTATVERRVLSETLVLTGQAAPRTSVSLVPVVADGAVAVITGAPKEAGDAVTHGDVLAVVSGRPVVALQGGLPAFRDLRPGDHGVDVEQLHAALRLAGLEVDDGDVFDAVTEAAIRALYERAGFEAPLTSVTLSTEIEAAERQVREAQRGLDAARADAARSVQDHEHEIETADREVAFARDALAVAKAESAGAVTVAEAELAGARARADRVAADPEATPEEREAAGIEVTQAEAELEGARLRGAASVRQAEAHLEGTIAALARVRAAAVPTAGVDAAVDALAATEAERLRLRQTSGAFLPRNEVLYVPSLPSTVATSAATVGAPPPPDGPLLTISSGEAMVRALASPAQRTLLRPGLGVTVTAIGGAHLADGRIDSVASEPAEQGGVRGFEVWVRPETPLGPEAFGQPLDVDVVLHATRRPVLAVPVTALSSRGDGAATVVKVTGKGENALTVVEVRVGASAGGFVEVSPAGDDLRVGDRVVVSQ